jgi:RND superfamily putative drug exporter
MLERWTRAIVKYRIAVLIAWALLGVIGIYSAAHVSPLLTTSLTVPNSDSAQADKILSKEFSENIEGTFTVIYKYESATKPEIEAFKAKVLSAAGSVPTAVVAQQAAVGGILLASITTSYNLIDAAPFTENLRTALKEQGLDGALVTGPPAVKTDITPVLAGDLHKGQVGAILLALILLIAVLGLCWAVLIPFIFAGATVLLTLTAIYVLAHKYLMVLYIPNIVELIGLGLAIDYSLLMVHRLRREIHNSTSDDYTEAIVRTMETAGRTVVLSGLTVSIGLATLLLVPVPFVRSLGAAGLLVPVLSIFTALTLQPALLSLLGRRGTTPIGFTGVIGKKDLAQGTWAKIARFVIRRPVAVLTSSLVLLGVISTSIIWLEVTPSSLTALPKQLESAQALNVVEKRVGPGAATPHEVVIDLGAPGRNLDSAIDASRLELASHLLQDPEIFIVATGKKVPYVDSSGRFIRLFIIGKSDLGAKKTQHLVRTLRSDYLKHTSFPAGTKIYLGGAPAQGLDLLDRIYGVFPWIVLLMLLLAYLILVRAFRSIIMPLKAILLDLVSIVVAYASLVWGFRFGIASWFFDTYRLDQIEAWALVFLFAVLFGLSMDYEVFIVSRMREAKDNGASDDEAIVEGLAHTGGVVTAAAVILVAALGGLVVGHIPGLQQIGVGLACGVLIDATIIRGLMLPAAMVLLGRWNWWLPSPIARVLKVKASPLED